MIHGRGQQEMERVGMVSREGAAREGEGGDDF
jgi:hypothetical protein